MAFGTIIVAFGTTNVGLCPEVGKNCYGGERNIIVGTSENLVRQIEMKNSFRNV